MADMKRDAGSQRGSFSTILAAETLRNSAASSASAEAREEKGIPLIWRIFGGTLLSIGALIAVTLYQQLFNKVESLGDLLVKREEFFNFRKGVWDYMEKLRSQEQGTDAELQQRCSRLEQQTKTADDQHKEMVPELQQMRDLLLTHLKETTGRLEQQLKAAQDDRRKLLGEVQHLRDRLTAMEAGKDPGVKAAVYGKK